MKITRLLGATALAGSLLVFPAAAFAQDASDPEQTATEKQQEKTEEAAPIVVTGSRIARPTLDSTVPVTSVDVTELTNQGNVALGDALNDLPSLRSTYSLGNSGRFIGTAGLSLLDLRGLGVSRTLVLVNGRRHVTSSPGDYLVDVNTIPVDLLERVDVVTGGNSAIYGSDAVAGVVNFVLKRDFDGIALRGQGGISERGDRGAYFASVTAGTNFAEGRGNVAVSAEIAKSNPLYFKDRDSLTGAYSGRCQFNTAEPQGTAGGETGPSASDGIPDNQFYCGVKNYSISNGGTIGSSSAGFAFRFAPDGSVYRDTPDGINFGQYGSGNWQGGEGSTLRDTGLLAAGLQRYDINLLAHFDVSDAFKPFIEAKYVHIDATQEGQPSFFQGGLLGTFSCNNPFLSPSALLQMQTLYAQAGSSKCGAPGTTPAANATFTLSRFNVDFGGRGELHKRDTYRIVGGFEGDFNDDWHYEVAFNWGRLETKQDSLNNLVLTDLDGNFDGYLLAYDAVLAPANYSGSNYVLGPTGAKVICAVNSGSTGNVRPDCVPINVFGENQADPRALEFVNTTSHRTEWAEEFVASAYVSGDLSQLFELPGGPIQFALGGEYRTETAYSTWDPLVQADATFLNALQTFDPPKFEVKEAYGELRIPLLKDLPGIELLSIEGAARVSDYNNATGTVWAYNISGIYAPIPDIRFRANYSTSVRAPTQSDLYYPQVENFANGLQDPCDLAYVNNNPNRVANCAAAGVATNTAATQAECASTAYAALATAGSPFVNCLARTSGIAYTSGGNAGLKQEEGKSFTVGAILTPRWVPGLSVTFDYYNIEVKNLIATLGAQTIVNLCYDDPNGINNQYCSTIQRDPSTGLFVEPFLVAAGYNFASQKTEGLDIDLAYNHRFANGHRLNIRGIATYLITLNNYTDPTNPDVPNRQKSELGSPEWAANASVNYDFGNFSLGYSVRYIGKQTIGAYETQNAFDGNPPQNADAYPFVYYPDVFYHNIRVGIDVDDFNFYLGVDNVTDELPPYGLLGTGSGDPFSSVGRYFYAGASVRF
ncbi:MAG: TonB-dependent receptor domain-containing protein [Pseudomonadota bacterium]